jgi:hypothetical protein
VRARFYAFAEAQGFVRARSGNPHFILFRRVTDSAVQLFELQWDKYHRQAFVVNFADAPRGGVTIHGTHIGAADIEPFQCPNNGQLTPRNCPYVRCWFREKKPLLEWLTSGRRRYQPDEVVEQLIALFPELEAWWSHQAQGPHLRFLRLAPQPSGA